MSTNITTTFGAAGARIGRAFGVINQMVADGIIQSYAIGGAMAAFFYVEPDTTFDVDIFCVLSEVKANAIDMLAPIYEYLGSKGYGADVRQGEAVNIEGIPVQFLPVFNELNEEGVERANELDYAGVPVKVMSPEHLVAIMLQTGRTKDYVRVARFLESGSVDVDGLTGILNRHGLEKESTALRRLQRRSVK